ncbi:MAG: hypothetical protein L6V93_19485 [Clostridiales bacterium]|nr:MAG: hypothetical protein L6V93_19485 [Clostridiales bacterium]
MDNIKILKELCVALELLKSGGSEKKYVLSEVDAKKPRRSRAEFSKNVFGLMQEFLRYIDFICNLCYNSVLK